MKETWWPGLREAMAVRDVARQRADELRITDPGLRWPRWLSQELPAPRWVKAVVSVAALVVAILVVTLVSGDRFTTLTILIGIVLAAQVLTDLWYGIGVRQMRRQLPPRDPSGHESTNT